MTDAVRADELAAKYIKLRDFKEKVKSEMDDKLGKVTSAMNAIEQEMMTFLNQTGQQNANTKFGTFAKKTATSARVADRDVFLKYVFDNEATNFLESRVNKSAVDEFIEAHGELPPGVDVTRTVTISVTRPKSR